MWKDTNYAAQVEEMKKAGLSVGLMYGKGGAGGATTGAGAAGVSESWTATDPNNINQEVNYQNNIAITYTNNFEPESATVKIKIQENVITK